MLLHWLLAAGVVSSAAASSISMRDLQRRDGRSKQPQQRPWKRDGVLDEVEDVSELVTYALNDKAPLWNNGTYNGTNSTLSAWKSMHRLAKREEVDQSCGKLTQAANKSKDGTVDAALAYACLMSVPFHQPEALHFIETLLPYVDFYADLAWVKDPPQEYQDNVKAPVDIIGCFNDVYSKAQGNSYTSEYMFSLDLQHCFLEVQDQHFGYLFDMAGGLFAFGRTNSLISVAPDANSPAGIYFFYDIDAVVNHNATFEPGCIVTINGENAQEAILKASLSAPIQDPDAAYNYLFGTIVSQPGMFAYGPPYNAYYPGPNTTYMLSNGSTIVDKTLAFFAGNFGTKANVQTGEEFYREYIAAMEGCDENNIGAVSIYEAYLCNRKHNSGSGNLMSAKDSGTTKDSASSRQSSSTKAAAADTTQLKPGPGFPDPVAYLNDTYAWGFLPDGEDLQDVAILTVSSFETVYGLNIDSEALAEFLGDFFQQATQANRTKLIVDLTGNLGGYEDGAFNLYQGLFPDLPPPVYGGPVPATDARNLLGQEISYTVQTVPNKQLEYISKYDSYNYAIDLQLDGSNFTSWEQKFGPASEGPGGQPYTPYWRVDTKYDKFVPPSPRSPFTVESTVLMSDGIVGSTASTFAELCILQGGIKTVAFGGRPGQDQMQFVGSTRSYETTQFLTLFQDIFSVFEEGRLHTPEYYNNTVLGEFNTLPVVRTLGGDGLAIKLAQDPSDESGTPIAYKYQPADAHLPFTFANTMSAAAQWADAAAAMF